MSFLFCMVLDFFLFQKKSHMVGIDGKVILTPQILQKIQPVLMIPLTIVFFDKVHGNGGAGKFPDIGFFGGECDCFCLHDVLLCCFGHFSFPHDGRVIYTGSGFLQEKKISLRRILQPCFCRKHHPLRLKRGNNVV